MRQNQIDKAEVGTLSYGSAIGWGCSAGPHAVMYTSGSIGVTGYCYDANGNMDHRWIPGGAYIYKQYWTADNKLSQIDKYSPDGNWTYWGTVAQFYYDADGNRIESMVNGVTTIYAGGHYEKNSNTGELTKYFYFGGQRVALRKYAGTPTNTSVTWLHSDHLGSASVATDGSGAVTAELRYKPFGEVRWSSGAMPNNRKFNGNLDDGLGLLHYGAREYSALLGHFISADSIVPGAGNPQAFNRYSYGFNSPLKYTDPSGHDPIDTAWEADFRKAHNRDPNEQDRRDRLFSVIFKGSGASGGWTDADWARYGANRNAYWTGEERWNEQTATGIDSFANHVDTLATWYKSGEEGAFAGAIGLVWGGIPYTNRFAGATAMANPGPIWAANPPLFEGNGNWRADMLDEGETNQGHHWAGFFYMGFFYETWVGYGVNRARDSDNTPDIVVGDAAVNHGRMLGAGTVNMSEVGDMIRQSFDSRPAIWGPNSPGSRSLSVFDHIP